MTTEGVSRLVTKLYSPAGVYVGDLGAIAASYQDRNSDVGSGTFTIRGSDPLLASIGPLSIVKYHLLGGIRFGARVGRDTATYPEGDTDVTFECLGLLGAVLSDAIVLDENGGIRLMSTGQRWLGWMSDAYDDSGWDSSPAANSFVWTDTDQSSERLGNPVDWPDDQAWWLHASGGGNWQLWRRDFNLAADSILKLWVSSDERVTVYFDGEMVKDEDSDETGYIKSNETELGIVSAGPHHVAVEVQVKPTPLVGDGFDGFILTIGKVDESGGFASSVVRSDNSSAWRNTGMGDWESPRPGISRGAAMVALWNQAVARDCHGPSIATLGFTATHDSAGVAWTDEVNQAVNLADQTLDQVFITLCEGVVDLGFDAATMTLHAWVRRGSDKSATVALKRGSTTVGLAEGANVAEPRTSRELQVVTDLYARMSNGRYTSKSDTGAVTALGGRIERGVSLGNTPPGTAQEHLTTLLAETIAPVTTLDLRQALHGAKPYVDYVIGDSITAPTHVSGTARARCTSITVDQPEGADWAEVTPGLMPDPA